jgi:hypothetical protein
MSWFLRADLRNTADFGDGISPAFDLDMAKANKVGTCNVAPKVWRALYGCEGEGRFTGWDRGSTSGASARPVYTCAACGAAKAVLASLNLPGYQAFLAQIQAIAGVENYRIERTITVDGRPALARHGKPLPSILERWPLLQPMEG